MAGATNEEETSMGLPKYKRLERELATKACGCIGGDMCDQHIQAMPPQQRRAYLLERRRGARGSQRGRGTA